MSHCTHPRLIPGLDGDYCPDCGKTLQQLSLFSQPQSYVTPTHPLPPHPLHKTDPEPPSYKTTSKAIRKAIAELPTEDQRSLLEWLQQLLAIEPEIEVPNRAGREVVDIRRVGAVVYQLEKVRCGKGACKSCPHGPYWYSYQRDGGRLKSKYVGKQL